jgi:YHS domain-containing protein
MKNTLLIGCATLMVASAAFAAAKPAAKPATKTAAAKPMHCAVMPSHTVNVKDATAKKMFADYNGNRYFFCCGGCPAEFKKDPAKFAKADHIAIPKTK